MEMTIEENIKQLETYSIPCGKYKKAYDCAVSTMRKYQQLQADYEAKLKADMVAMLEKLQLEIEETVKEEELIDKKWANGLHYSEKIIQQKIDALKWVEDADTN